MDARRKAERRLSWALIESRPAAAAATLETLAPEDVAEALGGASAAAIAPVLAAMTAREGAAVLARLPSETAGQVLADLAPHAGTSLLRRVPAGTREALLAALPEAPRRALQALLAHPDGTAGALADPLVLALPADLEVRAARARAMEQAAEAHYNVYVVGRDGRLVGVLNLRELLASPERGTLAEVMNDATFRIPARADRLEVIAHPGWKHVHSIPVVDDEDRLVGAIRYRTLRELEDELYRRSAGGPRSTGRALGELYWTGMAGMLEAMVAALVPGGTRGEDGGHGEIR